MKYLTLIFGVMIASVAFAQENKLEALPEIPSLNIDTQKQSSSNTQTAESQNTHTRNNNPTQTPKESQNASQPAQSQDALEPDQTPLSKADENNATKRSRDPFTPIITPKESGQIGNAPQLDLFTKTELILPSTARKIKKIIVEYQNLNGSITSIEQNLEGDIDWHFPLILSQEVQPKSPEVLDLQGFALGGLFDFEITKNTISLTSSLRLLRDFTLASPTRLVLDFKAPDKTQLQETFKTQIPSIPKVSLSTHLDFYRITLNLDGQYKYTLKQKDGGVFQIELY